MYALRQFYRRRELTPPDKNTNIRKNVNHKARERTKQTMQFYFKCENALKDTNDKESEKAKVKRRENKGEKTTHLHRVAGQNGGLGSIAEVKNWRDALPGEANREADSIS